MKEKCLILLFFLTVFSASCAESQLPGNSKNPEAVKEVLSGQRKTANAAWWGFDKVDSTNALQSAINSGASVVIVPYMGDDWFVRPILLASNQEIVFEKNVKIIARSNKNPRSPQFFLSKYASSLFTATDKVNIVLRGYGAIFKMRKAEYKAFPKNIQGGSRHAIRLNGCSNVKVLGLTLTETGGDGIIVTGGKRNTRCRGVLIKDVNCDNNYRNAITIGSVDGLVIEYCTLQNTTGSESKGGPAAGIDFETWIPGRDVLKNIHVRNCIIENNGMFGIVINPSRSIPSSEISILVEDCIVKDNGRAGLYVSRIYDNGPGGFIKFKNVTVKGGLWGVRIRSKSSKKASVVFEKCVLTDTKTHPSAYPINIYLPKEEAGKVKSMGGVEFIDCQIYDSINRPAIKYTGVIKDLQAISGSIYVENDKRKKDACDWSNSSLDEVGLITHFGIADFASEFDFSKKYDAGKNAIYRIDK